MKRILFKILAVLALLSLLLAAGAGFALYEKYKPSKELADQEAWYGVSGRDAAVFLDNERVGGVTALCENGQVYFPLGWVQETLNEKFYWDETLGQLIYTLPTEIVYADAATAGSGGAPLLLVRDGQVWLLGGLIETYTDVRITNFAVGGTACRTFVDTKWEEETTAVFRKKARIRVRGGNKSEILTEAAPGDEALVLEELEKWTYVRTADGHLGYVESRLLGGASSRLRVSVFEEPDYTSLTMDGPIVLVWHQVTNRDANRNLTGLLADTRGVNVVAPTWFMLTDNEGHFDSLADAAYVEEAHALGLSVWAVLDNFNRGAGVQSEILFASTPARKRLIASLMEEVKKYGIDGINLDIEGIKEEAGPHFVQFVRELSVSCRVNGIFLSSDTYAPTGSTVFYNRAEQGRVIDYLIMMGYDEHYAGGEPGSVSSLGFVRQGIEDMLTMVVAEKLVCALPFFTRVWKDDGTKVTSDALGLGGAKDWVEKNGVELYWQEEPGQYYGEVERDGVLCSIWMEEERSLSLKAELVGTYGLAGMAFWKLGLDTPEVWEALLPAQ